MWLLSPPKRHTPRPPLLKEEGNFLPPLRGSAPRVPFRLTILEGPADHCLLQRLLGAKPIGLLQGSLGSQKIPKVLEDLGGGKEREARRLPKAGHPPPTPPTPPRELGPELPGTTGTCEMSMQHSLSMKPCFRRRAHSRAPSRQRMASECCP